MLTYHATKPAQLPELLEILLAHLPQELRQLRIDLTISGVQDSDFGIPECDASDIGGPISEIPSAMPEFRNLKSDTLSVRCTRYLAFHYERAGQIVGGAFTMLRPDGTLLTLQPTVVSTEHKTTLRVVYETLLDLAVATRARLVMLLVDCQQSPDEDLLDNYGFEKISELLNLHAEQSVFPTRCPAVRLTFCPYQEERWQEMVAVVDQTYINTLDFPRLTGLVATDAILQGYRESHVFDPSLWFFVESQSQVIGALLLTQMENTQHLELTYLGLKKEFRGRGLSHEMTQFAQFVAGERNDSHLLVSVDSANTPALNTYLHNHFHLHDQKEIFVLFYGFENKSPAL